MSDASSFPWLLERFEYDVRQVEQNLDDLMARRAEREAEAKQDDGWEIVLTARRDQIARAAALLAAL